MTAVLTQDDLYPARKGAGSGFEKIQNTIDHVADKGKGAVWLDFDAVVEDTLLVPSNVSLLGPGRKIRTLTGHASLTAPVIRNLDNLNGNSDITLRGFSVDGNKANRTSTTSTVAMIVSLSQGGTGYLDRITVEDIEVFNCPHLGIQGARVRDSSFSYNYVHGNLRDGITFYYDCSDVKVHGNRVWDVDDDMLGFNAENPNMQTTGSVTSGSNQLTVAGVGLGVRVGDGLFVAGAGPAGAGLYTTVSAVNGTTITMAATASTTVSGVTVYGGTLNHPMVRMSIMGNILGPGSVAQAYGSGISLCGVQDSECGYNIIRDGWVAGITVANWHTTPAKNIELPHNMILTPGRFHPATSGSGIDIVGARTSSSHVGKAGCSNIKVIGGQIHDAKYYGIRALTQTDGPVEDITIQRVDVWNSGWSGSNQPGVYADGVKNLKITGVRSGDNQTPKTQTYGIHVVNPTGQVVLTENDCSDNLTNRFLLSGMTSASKLHIQNNPGFSPWASISSAAGAWTPLAQGAGTVYYKDIAVTFGTPFPTGVTPAVRAASQHTGIGASVVAPTNTGFTLRLWANNDPGSATHTAHWQADMGAS